MSKITPGGQGREARRPWVAWVAMEAGGAGRKLGGVGGQMGKERGECRAGRQHKRATAALWAGVGGGEKVGRGGED